MCSILIHAHTPCCSCEIQKHSCQITCYELPVTSASPLVLMPCSSPTPAPSLQSQDCTADQQRSQLSLHPRQPCRHLLHLHQPHAHAHQQRLHRPCCAAWTQQLLQHYLLRSNQRCAATSGADLRAPCGLRERAADLARLPRHPLLLLQGEQVASHPL
jgi:hypothetical protein